MDQVKTKSAPRRSLAEMYPLMEAYAMSGQTQAAFCADEGLKVGTFQYWWRHYRADEESGGGGGFVALEPQAASISAVELHYGGVHLRLNGVSSEYVAELVQQLAGSC